ncbi:hypothetical protein LTS18_013126, partial [Coniosporium uncinatum]
AVYGADVQGNTLAIIESPTASAIGNFRIVTISAISNFEVLALPSEADPLPGAGKVDHDALQRREDELVRRLKEEEANRGKGVTKEAQEVFDAMKRMLPARWHEKDIIVNDAVRISPPYKSENCEAPSNNQKSLPQVRKTLDNYWARKKQPGGQAQNAGRPGVVMPIPPRKGG